MIRLAPTGWRPAIWSPKRPKNTRVRNPVGSVTRILSGWADDRGFCTSSIVTSKVITSPSTAWDRLAGLRRISECGFRNATSRTIGPASRSSRGATRGPTPLSEVIGANSGNRISGRIIAPYPTGAGGRGALYRHLFMNTDSDARLKKLKFRAWRRGFREADLILGPFADKHCPAMGAAELDEFEALLEQPDH